MRRVLIAAAFFFLLPFGAPADAAPCAAGVNVTLEGEIIIPPVVDGGEWFWPGKFANKPCQVTTLRGKGALPSSCRVGKSMTLWGRVVEDGILTLHVERIRCY